MRVASRQVSTGDAADGDGGGGDDDDGLGEVMSSMSSVVIFRGADPPERNDAPAQSVCNNRKNTEQTSEQKETTKTEQINGFYGVWYLQNVFEVLNPSKKLTLILTSLSSICRWHEQL